MGPPFRVAVVHGEGGTGGRGLAVKGTKRRQGTLDGRLGGLVSQGIEETGKGASVGQGTLADACPN